VSFFQKIKESAMNAADKAQQTVEITRIHTRISSKEKEIADHYKEMGKCVFDAYVAGDPSAAEAKIAECAGKVLEIQKEIAALKHKIMEIKNEKPCECGTTAPFEALFCPSCGRKFETVAKEPQALALAEGPATRHCTVCGGELETGDKFCVHCGAPQSAAKEGIDE